MYRSYSCSAKCVLAASLKINWRPCGSQTEELSIGIVQRSLCGEAKTAGQPDMQPSAHEANNELP